MFASLRTRICIVLTCLMAVSVASAETPSGFFTLVAQARKASANLFKGSSTVKVPFNGEVEMAFSPDGGGEQLVTKVIQSATTSLHVMAYSFTSSAVTRAILDAKARNSGMPILVVVDYKNNVGQDQSGKARAALSALHNAGIQVRTVKTFAIHHDKVVIADGRTVQTGSFNYSAAAQKSNSENVVVLWNSVAVARPFLDHFSRNFEAGEPWQTRY